MKKSVQDQLLEYLQANPGVHASGTLQRLEWHNKDSTLAVPRTIVRRLQELAEESKIHATLINGHTHYSATPIEKPKTPSLVYDPINNVMVRA